MNDYKKYLYNIASNSFLIPFMENNIQILNEVYFGKTEEMKLLETIFKIYYEYAKDGTTYDLHKYEINNITHIQTKEFKNKIKMLNRNKILGHMDSFGHLDLNPFDRKLEHSFTSDYLKQLKCLMEDYFELIFGFVKVKIRFADETEFLSTNTMAQDKDKSGYFYGQKTYNRQKLMNQEFEKGRKFSKQLNRKKIPGVAPREDAYFTDYFGRQMSLEDIRKTISITDTGIYFNPEKFAVNCKITIPRPESLKSLNLTDKDLLALFLHEIGHNFQGFFLPSDEVIKYNHILGKDELFTSDVRIVRRRGEIFADKFVSLYGYASEFILAMNKLRKRRSFSLKTLNMYMNDKEEFKKYIESRVKKDKRASEDVHPLDYTRLHSLKDHLRVELRDPRISKEQRKKIKKDLDNVYDSLRYYKQTPKFSFSYKDGETPLSPEELERATKIMTKAYNDIDLEYLSKDEENREYQKESKVDSKRLQAQMNLMYDNSKKKQYTKVLQGEFYKDKSFYIPLSKYEKNKVFNSLDKLYDVLIDEGPDSKKIWDLIIESVKYYYARQIHWAETLGYYYIEGIIVDLADDAYQRLMNEIERKFPKHRVSRYNKDYNFKSKADQDKLSEILLNLFYYGDPAKEWERVEKRVAPEISKTIERKTHYTAY